LISILRSYRFIFLCTAAFLFNYLLEKAAHVHIPWVHAYMDDLLVIPVILGITLWAERMIYRNPRYTHSSVHIVFTLLLLILVFEFILPRYSAAYISDPWDILCYMISGILYGVWLRNNTPGKMTMVSPSNSGTAYGHRN
jgi:hypothetical protein